MLRRYLFPTVTILSLSQSAQIFAQQIRKKDKNPIAAPARELIENELLTGMIENLSSLNEFQLCESILKEHLGHKKNDPHALLLLSSTYSSWKKFDAADRSLKAAEKYRTTATDPAFLAYQKALLLSQQGDTAGSLSVLQELSQNPSPKIAVKANRAILSLKNNPNSPVPSWLERRHISRREINEVTRQKLIKSADEQKDLENLKIPNANPGKPTIAALQSSSRLAHMNSVQSLSPWWPLRLTGSASLSFGSSYDSNILQIPDKLAPQVSDKSGVVHSGSLQTAVSSTFGPGNLSCSAAVSSSMNANQDASNLNNFNASQTLQWSMDESPSGFSWGLTNALTGSFMNTNGYKLYNWGNTSGVILAKRLTDAIGMDVGLNGGLQKFPGVEINSSDDDRNGLTYGTSLNANASLGEYSLNSGVVWSKQNSKGKNFRTYGTSASLNASRTLSFLNSQISWNSSATRSQFPEASNTRTDTQLSTGLSFGLQLRPISEKTKLTLSSAYQSSASSVPDAAFKKYTISVAVDHAF